MEKEIINVGGESLGIRFTKNEIRILGLNKGDLIKLDEDDLRNKKNVTSIMKALRIKGAKK